MLSFFALLVLGHLVGDYFLQNDVIARKKTKSTWVCTVHCLLYTLAVAVLTYPYITGWLWCLWIFLSHWPIDRFSLADKYALLIGGRSLTGYLSNGTKDIPEGSLEYQKNYHALRGGFTAFCYVMIDNTMHLLLMYFGALFLKSMGL